MIQVCCFGEILWDVFPSYKRIGGAPLNVALRLHSLGADVAMISRLGSDQAGDDIMDFLQERQLSTEHIQRDKELPTGTVDVHLDSSGTATYTINEPAAWDRIQVTTPDSERIEDSRALIFGSLVCRRSESRSSLDRLLELANYRIFDLNLRTPFYDLDHIGILMQRSDFIKMNEEELEEVCSHQGIRSDSLEESVLGLIKHLGGDKSFCITRGAKGALLYYEENFYSNPGYKVEVADTVGAGDSFLATLIFKLLSGSSPQQSIDIACAVGSLVASKEGATPEISNKEIHLLIQGS